MNKLTALKLATSLGIVLAASSTAFAVNRTSTVYTSTSNLGVTVIPYVRADKKALLVDFEDKNFKNIEYIYYNLNYDSDGGPRGVEGSFTPTQIPYTGWFNRKPYIRMEWPLGSCSKGECTYDKSPKNVKLTVNTKMKSGKIDQYTKVLTFSDDQFSQ